MDIDATFILLAGVGIFFLCCAFLLVGRLLDPMFRVKQLRRFLKRNYLVMFFVSKDGKTVQPRVINADDDTFIHRGSLYVVEKGKIYRRTQAEAGGKALLDKDGKPVYSKEGGFNFNPAEGEKPIRYEEGVPVIYVDNEHVTPLQFNNEDTKVTPSGAGSAVNAWIINQIAKGLVGENKYITIGLIIIGLLAIASLYFGYQANNKIDTLMANGCSPAPAGTGQVVKNNTVIINQPITKTEGVIYDYRVSGL